MKKTTKWITIVAASALAGMMLMACTPSSLDKAREKMAFEGYKVEEIKGEGVEGFVGGITAYKAELDDGASETDTLMAYLFDSKKAAKEFYEKNKALAEEEGMGSLLRDGKWVYMGTADAIEDFTD